MSVATEKDWRNKLGGLPQLIAPLVKLQEAIQDASYNRLGKTTAALEIMDDRVETTLRDLLEMIDRHFDLETLKMNVNRPDSIHRHPHHAEMRNGELSSLPPMLNANQATLDCQKRMFGLAAGDAHTGGNLELSARALVFPINASSSPTLESQGTESGEPVFNYWREVARPFHGSHSLTGQTLDFPKSRIEHWYETDKKMIAAGFRIPLNDNHNVYSAGAGLGDVTDFKIDASGILYAKFKIIGEKNRDIFLNNAVSITIEPAAKDASGNVWHDAITSIAATQRGQLGGMGGAIAASAIPIHLPDGVNEVTRLMQEKHFGDVDRVNAETKAAMTQMMEQARAR